MPGLNSGRYKFNAGLKYLKLGFGGFVVFAVALGVVAGIVDFAVDGFGVVDGFAVVAAAALFVVDDTGHRITLSRVRVERVGRVEIGTIQSGGRMPMNQAPAPLRLHLRPPVPQVTATAPETRHNLASP
jgi:hypothetical protein